MTQQKAKAREIAQGRWREILQASGIEAEFLKKKEGPCPICGGKSRFFFDDKDGKGTFCCRYCGAGDGFKLLGLHLNMEFKAAADYVEVWFYGLPVASRPPQKLHQAEETLTAEEIEKRRAKHKHLWEASVPISEGDPVWKYLKNRIPGFDPLSLSSNVVRYKANEPYYGSVNGHLKKLGCFPIMAAAIVGPDGKGIDIHRTYLTMDGHKAPVEEPKKTLATIGVKGGAIRLARPNGKVLGVAEGIETSIAVMLFKHIPCWPLVNTSGMKNFIVPPGITDLHIFADNDRPNKFGVRAGFKAASQLSERVKKEGIRVHNHAPATQGTDMLDLLCSMQSAA